MWEQVCADGGSGSTGQDAGVRRFTERLTVPGGWLYRIRSIDGAVPVMTFVPTPAPASASSSSASNGKGGG